MTLLRRRGLQVQEGYTEWTYHFGNHCTFHFGKCLCIQQGRQADQLQLLPQFRLMLELMQ